MCEDNYKLKDVKITLTLNKHQFSNLKEVIDYLVNHAYELPYMCVNPKYIEEIHKIIDF